MLNFVDVVLLLMLWLLFMIMILLKVFKDLVVLGNWDVILWDGMYMILCLVDFKVVMNVSLFFL